MQRMTAIVSVLIVLGAATGTSGEAQQRRRIIGQQLGGHFQFDPVTRTTTDTATLTFAGNDGGPALTVDFTTRFSGVGRPTSTPAVVDIVVTQHAVNDDAPEMAMRVDGEAFPLTTRLRSRRSVVASIPFDQFIRLTNAETIVEQAFDTELAFSAAQVRMLRSTAQRWAGR